MNLSRKSIKSIKSVKHHLIDLKDFTDLMDLNLRVSLGATRTDAKHLVWGSGTKQ